MSMGGGESGGVLTQGPSPGAVANAGYYQTQAAQAAANAATRQTQEGINLIREQYGNAFTALKPYTMEGIQALNQLNQYMGLTAYNPGTAPRAPKENTIENALGRYTDADVRDYINSNTNLEMSKGIDSPGSFMTANYSGIGANPNTRIFVGGDKPGSASSLVNSLVNNGSIAGQVKNYLADQFVKSNADNYQSQLDQFNQQMDIYNFAKDQQTTYDAQGPLSPDQVTEKLSNTPGYQFQMGQGMDALQRAASSKGLLGSGRLLQELVNYGQGMASQTYGDTLNRLAALAGAGQNAATTVAGASANLGNQLAGLKVNLGDTLANSSLAQGNALSQSILAGNQQYKMMGQSSGGGGMSGLGSVLGGIGSIASSGLFSSRQLKTPKMNISPVERQVILDRVNELKIDKWTYKGIQGDHLGPYAEDFAEKFGVGDGRTINIIDALGVLFTSVQALSQKLDELTTETK